MYMKGIYAISTIHSPSTHLRENRILISESPMLSSRKKISLPVLDIKKKRRDLLLNWLCRVKKREHTGDIIRFSLFLKLSCTTPNLLSTGVCE